MGLPSHTDVVIAGAGVAGASAAAALGEFGYKVFIAEPGLDSSKRLAGEWIHPPGASALAELGLLRSLEEAGGMPALGFAVFPDPFEHAPQQPSGDRREQACLLPYAEVPGLKNQGFTIEHARLRECLVRALEDFPHVTVCHGARITAVDLSDREFVRVTISRDGCEFPLRARLLVAADGVSSKITQMAGIAQRRMRISNSVGYLLQDFELPHPGFGHVFLGGPAPALAYAIAPGKTRVVFDTPDKSEGAKEERDPICWSALPPSLQVSLRRTLETERAQVSANYTVIPDRVVEGRLVLVGDAGGCCHPLTATGLSVCAQDALRLRKAIRETGCDIPRALQLYSRRRRGPQRTRLALANALYETFRSQTPEVRLLRDGLLRYWSQSPRGRAASMALLSTCEDRLSVMSHQYMKVMIYGLTTPFRSKGTSETASLGLRIRALVELSFRVFKYAGEALRVG